MPRRYLGQAACGAGFPCPAVRDRLADLSIGSRGAESNCLPGGASSPGGRAGSGADCEPSGWRGGQAAPQHPGVREASAGGEAGGETGPGEGTVQCNLLRQKCPLQWPFPGCS